MKKYKVTNFVKLFLIGISIITVIEALMIHQFASEFEFDVPFGWWYVIPVIPIAIFLSVYFYKTKYIALDNDKIILNYPVKEKEEVELKKIEALLIKKKNDLEWIDSVRNERLDEYKIALFIGKEKSNDFLKSLDKILKEKNLDVELIEL